jgi:hypothetical protein
MEYSCKYIPISKLPVGPKGVVQPLCSSCDTADCTNHIETREVNVFGIMKVHRLLVKGGEPHQVIECGGYIRRQL